MWESDTHPGGGAPGRHPRRHLRPGGRAIRGGTPRGMPNAFTSLGPDVTPPSSQVTSPSDGGVVAAGADGRRRRRAPTTGWAVIAKLEVSVTTTAATIDARDCPVAGGGTASCTFTFVAPQPASRPRFVDRDGGGHRRRGPDQLSSRPRWRCSARRALPAISPASGSTLGGTAVTLSGANFVPGSRRCSSTVSRERSSPPPSRRLAQP